MSRRSRVVFAVLSTLLSIQSNAARAQWGFPVGFDGFGWHGWGVGSVEGDLARGLGALAAAEGVYNKQTAIANSINADTVMRWNDYLHESQMMANRRRQERLAASRDRNAALAAENQKRLRDNPEPRDIFQGDALNVALDEIDDPRVYTRALHAATVKIGGDKIRLIPFRYAAAAMTMSVHQLAAGTLPSVLSRPEFKSEIEAIRALDRQLTAEIEDGKEPDPSGVQKLLAAIYAAEEKADSVLAKNSLQHKQAVKYLKALHGMVAMLKAPAIDRFVAGVERRPEATLGELLSFMTAFNLRFGVASTPEQREVYTFLYPKLVELRSQIAPALAASPVHTVTGAEAESFFAGMSEGDLRKKAPKP